MTWNGNLIEGRLVTRCFWDGRDLGKPLYYYLETIGNQCTLYREFNPHFNEWTRIGHDEMYQPPRKDNIVEECIEFLRGIPFSQRLNAYRSGFEKRYPYLSYEYHPFLSKAWRTAICTVTTEEEVIDHQAHWQYCSKFPSYALDYLVQVVFPLEGKERLETIYSMKYIKDKPQYITSFFYHLPKNNFSVYGGLIKKLMKETESLSNFKVLCRIWGSQIHRVFRDGENSPRMFWL